MRKYKKEIKKKVLAEVEKEAKKIKRKKKADAAKETKKYLREREKENKDSLEEKGVMIGEVVTMIMMMIVMTMMMVEDFVCTDYSDHDDLLLD